MEQTLGARLLAFELELRGAARRGAKLLEPRCGRRGSWSGCARLGGGGVPGVGRNLQRRGLHPTSVVGRAGAAAVACVLLGLDHRDLTYRYGGRDIRLTDVHGEAIRDILA